MGHKDFSAMIRGVPVGHRMKHRVSENSIALVAVLLVALAGRTVADDSLNAQQFLEALREHDSRFDNCSLQWTQRETRRIDERAEYYAVQFNNSKFGRETPPQPAEFPDPYDATVMHNCQLTQRGNEFIISFVRLTDRHGHPQPASEPQFCKWTDGMVKVLDLDPNHRFLYIHDADNMTNFAWKRAAYLMSLGIGYSRWLQEIESLEQSDDGWTLMGSMQLFGVDHTDCELELDADRIVRKARLYCVVGADDLTRERVFEFSSSGVREDAEGPLLAESGMFRETTVVAVIRGESREVNQPGDNWTIDAGPVEFELSDERYSELTWLDEESVDQVLDQRRR
jgi:hypothetical protein